MKRKSGFTLVELLIVMAILIIMITVAIGIINPIAMKNRATDARVKKDLKRIQVAFEEYRSDKKMYPDNLAPDYWLTKLRDKTNCGTDVFSPWLANWPCDASGNPFQIAVNEGPSVRWYKVLTKLRNKFDSDIPAEVKERDRMTGNRLSYNYGVSSPNINWFSLEQCGEGCSVKDGVKCGDYDHCAGENCYMGTICDDSCLVVSCIR